MQGQSPCPPEANLSQTFGFLSGKSIASLSSEKEESFLTSFLKNPH
jgi:hypothetical protein